MAKILAGRFNRWAEKLFATKEGRATIDTLSPEIISVIPLFYGVECRYLEGWSRFMQQFTQGALAANFSEGELRNPAGSNIIAVVESIIFVGSAGDVPKVILAPNISTDLTTVSNPVDRIDARGQQSSSIKLSVGTAGANPAGGSIQVGVVANSSVQVISNPNQEITILPGDALFVSGGAVNTLVNAFLMWRERVLESSELS